MTNKSTQSLHLVFGGELADLDSFSFQDTSKLDVIGIFPDYHDAYDAWKSAAHRTVDNAMARYFIVPLHYLMDPEKTGS